MAEDQKKTPAATLPTPSNTPVVDSGAAPVAPTVIGVERPKPISVPDISVSKDVEGFVKVEATPESQIPLDYAGSEKQVEINRAAPPLPPVQNNPVHEEEEEKPQNPKIIPIEKALEIAKKKRIPTLQIGKYEFMDSEDALADLEKKTEEWRKENAA